MWRRGLSCLCGLELKSLIALLGLVSRCCCRAGLIGAVADWCVLHNRAVETIFQGSNILLLSASRGVQLHNTCCLRTCLAWVRSGQVAAFVSDRPLLSYQAHLQPCDMVVVGDDFGPGAWVRRYGRGGCRRAVVSRTVYLWLCGLIFCSPAA